MRKRLSAFNLRFCERHEKSPRELIGERDFRLDVGSLVGYFRKFPSDRVVDLLRVAMSIYVIDRLVRRNRRIARSRWSRSLQAQVSVLVPDFWNSAEVRDALTECVEFVSGDNWDFRFDGNSSPVSFHRQQFLSLSDEAPLVNLYSGGLDSAAGLASRIAECPDRPVMPVTVWHQSGQRKRILERQHPKLKERFGVTLTPVLAKASIAWSPELKKTKEERSQRCRSFLFAALGAAVAALTGSSSVEVYESGLGAINLPLMSGMVGSRATRNCHPEFLRRMSRLCTLVAGREIGFHLPFLELTKGQMVKRLVDSGLSDLARTTVSCVHFPLRDSMHKQCGVCPACLFRRVAMFAGGVDEPQDTYRFDLFGSAVQANRVHEKRLKYLKAALMQVVQLGSLEAHGDVPARILRHLKGTGVVQPGDPLSPLIDVLRQYRHEWLQLAAQGEQQNWAWTKLLGASASVPSKGVSHASA